ncbi:molybdenum cofactor guanylyltransferase [Aquiflexum sp.]|uniref:molybdenum cofactor guanylyltransferase n=1 Tax=Aquiflexum sp. TaxID=1872584 RepID=UPI003593B16F
MVALQDIEAFVLAGGKSRRMGEDKGLALLNGSPMITSVIKSLQSIPLEVKLISANPDYNQFYLPLYKDSIQNKGPMGGLITALEQTSAPYVLLMGCDMPFITKKAISHLIDNSKENKITVAGTNGYINPLLAIYPKSILPELKEHIENDRLKMQDFISSQDHHIVKMDEIEKTEPTTLTNINSREELDYWNKQ